MFQKQVVFNLLFLFWIRFFPSAHGVEHTSCHWNNCHTHVLMMRDSLQLLRKLRQGNSSDNHKAPQNMGFDRPNIIQNMNFFSYILQNSPFHTFISHSELSEIQEIKAAICSDFMYLRHHKDELSPDEVKEVMSIWDAFLDILREDKDTEGLKMVNDNTKPWN